ncbi:hypothetical protein CR205_13440 [Alteribacter lacisalsi]|uniref:DUF3311 domain-containing protein n=1 Tax=Alteribacter lacisalsi TaxID=2045244 RepID=A0A2W0H6F3_9BACI|nr:hypothetical protein [Alteribacter lacisalsi]PYZ96697.1 hypothetical protein CR205_13440 [Alteribacter lacisalsi]
MIRNWYSIFVIVLFLFAGTNTTLFRSYEAQGAGLFPVSIALYIQWWVWLVLLLALLLWKFLRERKDLREREN